MGGGGYKDLSAGHAALRWDEEMGAHLGGMLPQTAQSSNEFHFQLFKLELQSPIQQKQPLNYVFSMTNNMKIYCKYQSFCHFLCTKQAFI